MDQRAAPSLDLLRVSGSLPQHRVLENAARGHRAMLLAQLLKLVCKLTSVLWLARLVSPNDHGLFAMASTVVLLLSLFRDAGLGAAAVQAPALTPLQLTTLYWCHLGIGIVLTLLTVAVAPLAAWFYAAPAALPLLLSMSLAFLLIGAGGFVRTQLERASRFGAVAGIEVTAVVGGTLAMIGAALLDAGAYSFVAYLIISEAVATVLAWRALRWKPHGKPQWSSIRRLLRTGGNVTGYHVMVHLLQQVDAIVVGRFFGAHVLGLYNRAGQLLALPQLHLSAPLNQVAVVTLSRLGGGTPEFTVHARTTATVVAHLVLPLFAVCAMLPAEVVRLVLGPQWPEAAPFLRVLSFAAAATTLTSLSYAINLAAGQTHRMMLAAAAALPLTLAAVLVGTKRGPLGVAESIAAMNMLLLWPRLWWTLRELPGGLAAYIGALAGPALSTAAAVLGLWLGRTLTGDATWFVRLGVGAIGGILGIILMAALSPRVRGEWRTVASYLPLPWRKAVPPGQA